MINPCNLQFGMMMTQAVKYALGREDHVPIMTCDYIKPLLHDFDLSVLYIMEKDITKSKDLGDQQSKCEWLILRNEIQKEIARRKEDKA